MAIASKLGQVHAGAVIWASNASPDVIEGHVLIPGNYIYWEKDEQITLRTAAELVKLHCVNVNLGAIAKDADALEKKLNAHHFVTMAIPVKIH